MARILVTGSHGLVGSALRRWMTLCGHEVLGLDSALPDSHTEHGDVVDRQVLAARSREVNGIVHLAAIARVRHAEADPDRCWLVNVTGTENLIAAALAAPRPPWVLTVSSREVYGEPSRIPVVETDPIAPINVYGRSKAACEEVTLAGRDAGLTVAILRLANVYGGLRDHADRVIPAFCRAAALGAPMRVEGPGYTFDFTHIFDVVCAIERVVCLLETGRRDLSPIHLASGRAVRLDDLARMANAAGGGRSQIVQVANQVFNVSCFVGDPTRASELLRWRAKIPVEAGVRQLVADFRAAVDGTVESCCPRDGLPR